MPFSTINVKKWIKASLSDELLAGTGLLACRFSCRYHASVNNLWIQLVTQSCQPATVFKLLSYPESCSGSIQCVLGKKHEAQPGTPFCGHLSVFSFFFCCSCSTENFCKMVAAVFAAISKPACSSVWHHFQSCVKRHNVPYIESVRSVPMVALFLIYKGSWLNGNNCC